MGKNSSSFETGVYGSTGAGKKSRKKNSGGSSPTGYGYMYDSESDDDK